MDWTLNQANLWTIHQAQSLRKTDYSLRKRLVPVSNPSYSLTSCLPFSGCWQQCRSYRTCQWLGADVTVLHSLRSTPRLRSNWLQFPGCWLYSCAAAQWVFVSISPRWDRFCPTDDRRSRLVGCDGLNKSPQHSLVQMDELQVNKTMSITSTRQEDWHHSAAAAHVFVCSTELKYINFNSWQITTVSHRMFPKTLVYRSKHSMESRW